MVGIDKPRPARGSMLVGERDRGVARSFAGAGARCTRALIHIRRLEIASMSVRNLEQLFKPSSVALVGASTRFGRCCDRAQPVPLWVCRASAAGQPAASSGRGRFSLSGWSALPLTPDLAIISAPPPTVPGLIAELGAGGTRAAVVITAGFSCSTLDGATLRQQVLDAARPHLLRILGPNCLGLMVPGIGLNGSFAHISPQKGGLAFVTQSGAMATVVLDWATARGIDFSHFVSLGDMADVDFGDLLDYLAVDPGTHAVLLYIEAVSYARKFMSAARACARLKPLIVIKAGRHAAGARAVASHTGLWPAPMLSMMLHFAGQGRCASIKLTSCSMTLRPWGRQRRRAATASPF